MKRLLTVLLLASLSLGVVLFTPAEPAQAQANPSAAMLTAALSLPLCDGLALTSPADNPAFVGFDAAAYYGWQGEPGGVTRREVVVYNVAQGGGLLDLTPFAAYEAGWTWQGALAAFVAAPGGMWINLSAFNGLPGTYHWLAVFYGPEGTPLCRSGHHWLDVRTADASTDGSGSEGGGSSAQPTGQHTPPQQPADPCAGRPMIIVLFGSPYGGERDLDVYTNNFTGSECGETIHGNDNENRINGMGGNDTIFGYGAGDVLIGGTGNDTIYGGAGYDLIVGGNWIVSDSSHVYGGVDGNDALYGEADFDELIGGNLVICVSTDCHADGGIGGDDYMVAEDGYILGGNSVDCVGDNCSSWGGIDGNDTLINDGGGQLNGGNQVGCGNSISPFPCSADGGIDGNDTLIGTDAGNFYANGGNTVWCGSGSDCSASGGVDGSDTISTGDGSDVLLGGNNMIAWNGPTDTGTIDPGSDGADTLNAGSGDDMLQGGNAAACATLATCNVIGGSDGADTLNGGPGADTLDGNQDINNVTVDDGAADTLDCGLDADADTANLMPGDTATNCP